MKRFMTIVRVATSSFFSQRIQWLIRYICNIDTCGVYNRKIDMSTAGKTELSITRFSNIIEEIHKKQKSASKNTLNVVFHIMSEIELTQESFRQDNGTKYVLFVLRNASEIS